MLSLFSFRLAREGNGSIVTRDSLFLFSFSFLSPKWSSNQNKSLFFLSKMSGRSNRRRAADRGGGGSSDAAGGAAAAAAEQKTNSDNVDVDDAQANARRQVVTLVDASEQSLDRLLSRAGRRRGIAHDAALRRVSQVSLCCGGPKRKRKRKRRVDASSHDTSLSLQKP